MLVWGDYLAKRGNWQLTTKPSDEVDVIWAGSDGLIEEGLKYKERLGKPLVVYVWGWPFFRLLQKEWWRFYIKKAEMVSRADMVLVPSLITYYQLADFGIQSHLCLPGIDSQLIDSIPQQNRKQQVIYLGRLAHYRRVDVLIRAVSVLNPKPKLVLAGWDNPELYRKLAKNLNVNCEIAHPNDQEKIRLLKESMVFVCPCVYAGFGMPPLEAIYSGTPVLASDIPIHREVLKEVALYFSSVEECADLITYVIENRDVAKELVEKGRMYVAENLTFEKAAERLERILNNILEGFR